MLVDKKLIIEAKKKLGVGAAKLIAKDLNLEKWDDKDNKGCCPFHKEDTPSLIWNEKNDSFKCFGCGKNYDIINHYMAFNKLAYYDAVAKLFKETGQEYSFGEKSLNKQRDYKYPHHIDSTTRAKTEEYLAERKLSKETLDYFDVQEDNNCNMVFHFYNEDDVLTLVKYRPSRKLGKTETKTWCQKDADTKQILFNMNKIDVTKPLICVEGEIDCMSVFEAGWQNVVSVPFGSQSLDWIKECYEWLEQFDKIIIWSDNDAPGQKMRREACSRLGTWRCYFVNLPEKIQTEDKNWLETKDANAVLYHFGKEKVMEFINNAEEIPVPNIVDLSEVDDFNLEEAPGLYTGIKPIDDIIYKFVFGSVVILTGLRGSGKSSFLNQAFVAESLHQGHDVFIFSGELSSSILKSWIETTLAGSEKVKMKNQFIRVIDMDTKRAIREWYRGRVYAFDDIENNADKILDRAINCTRRFGTKVWILDNLLTLDLNATNDQDIYQCQKKFIVKLVSLAKSYGVLVVLVAHPRKTSEIRRLTADDVAGSNDMSNLSQYVLSVHRYTRAEKEGEKDSKGNYRKGKEPIDEDAEVEVFKNRMTGKVGEARVFFDYPSMRFYSGVNELYKRYKWNKDVSAIPKTLPVRKGDNPFE